MTEPVKKGSALMERSTDQQDKIDGGFLKELKDATERRWQTQAIDPSIYGFQFQRRTRWMPGLSDEQITEYEKVLGTKLPGDLSAFLRAMNGTDLPTLNVYGSCGEPPRHSTGVYSYPRDVKVVEQLIEEAENNRAEIADDLASQGFYLMPQASLIPIFGHRYVACTPESDTSVVLSIVVHDVDAIVFGNSLREYLRLSGHVKAGQRRWPGLGCFTPHVSNAYGIETPIAEAIWEGGAPVNRGWITSFIGQCGRGSMGRCLIQQHRPQNPVKKLAVHPNEN